MVRDGSAVLWLAWLAEGLPRALLLPLGGAPQLRACLQELSHSTGVAGLHLVPGSLLSGGAIAYMDEVGNLPVLSGRWRNPSPLEHYLLEKIAFPLTTSLSTIAEDRLERLEEL